MNELTKLDKNSAMENLIFLVEKRDETINGRTCANSSTQRESIEKDMASSPTAILESILLNGTIDAKQYCDIMTGTYPTHLCRRKSTKRKREKELL
jgi:hypothetical protein